MNTSPHPQLVKFYEQKQQLEKLEEAFSHREQWQQKRDELEKILTTLNGEIEREFYQRHQKGSFAGENEVQFQEMVKKKRQKVQELKQIQYQIDQSLDLIEDVTEQDLLQKRFDLLQTLWQIHPEKQSEQELKWNERNQLKISQLELSEIAIILEQLETHLNYAVQARQSIRGVGIFKYIFGTSPNIIIEKQLLSIHALIAQSEPLFKKMQHLQQLPAIKTFLQDLTNWLEQIKSPCCKPWSFRKLDAFCAEMRPILNQMIDQLKKLQVQTQERLQILNIEIREWPNQEIHIV